MTRKCLLLALGFVPTVLILGGTAWWWLTPPRLGITEANARRIKPGMTLAQVEALMGGPPGEYCDGKLSTPLDPGPALYPEPSREPGEPLRWRDNRGALWYSGYERLVGVKLNRDDTVAEVPFCRFYHPPEPPSAWERLCAWLRPHRP